MKQVFRTVPVIAIVLLLNACERVDPVDHGAVSEWRVVIELPGMDLPVSMHLAPDGSEAWFRNGVERVTVPETRVSDTGVVLRFPAFNNTIELRRTGTGYEGSLTLVKRGYEQVMPVRAEPDPGFRFLENPGPATDFTGRWEVGFIEEDGSIGAGVGEFDQQDGRVSGTFLTPTGDYRYLEGNVDGTTMYLSAFDGAHAFAFRAEMGEDETLKGEFWSGTKWHQQWNARRNFDAALPDAYQLTWLKEGYDRLDFTFPDLDGNPVSLGDDKYQGKVVLVTLAGTWCPNCADEMEFLAPVFRERRNEGLEITTLLYEHFLEFEIAAGLGRVMAEKHGVEFDVLVAGSSDKAEAAATLPMLNHVMAFPTLIFIDRHGIVRNIHTGFTGPGTGRYFEEFKEKFTAQLDALLAEDQIEGP